VHVSGHKSLRDAIEYLSVGRVHETALIAQEGLQGLGIAAPRLAIAGLNPHAGEGGAFGHEEEEIIAPAAALCRAEGMDCSGPIAPDAVFRHLREGRYDAVVALYHDQGHIPLKLLAMDEGVNVTLGLPIIRTSVDHGTAYDIAWQGRAREGSLCAALRLAEAFLAVRHREARA
jgi:4-hydroxythreonine-4-phosphate dehydrogenase